MSCGGQKLCAVKIHKQLKETKKLKAETYREYLYRLMTIAEQGDIDIESTIQYVIDGIDDTESNKTVLYGVTTLDEIKIRLDAYKLMKSKFPTQEDMDVSKTNKNNSRGCFRCGETGHDVKSCTNELKSFKCSKGGHIANDCSSTEDEKPKTEAKPITTIKDDDDSMITEIKILNFKVRALVDTGSDYNLVKLLIYFKFGSPKLHQESVGQGVVKTLGWFEIDIEDNGTVYTTVIHVVPEDGIIYDMLIGTPLLRQSGLISNDDGLKPW